jgi:PAS domain S-box-containing protein
METLGMKGVEIAELMRGDSKTKDISIIFLSANTTQEDSYINIYKEERIDYTTMPIDENLLLQKVTFFLKLHHSALLLKKVDKKLRKKAVKAEISYQDLYYSLSQEIFLVNREGIIVNINREGVLCCGFYAKDLLNQHYEKSPFLNRVFGSFGNNGNFFRYFFEQYGQKKRIEFQFEKPDKTIVYCGAEMSMAVIGGKFNVQVSVNDITEKKIRELALTESEERFKLAMQGANDGLWDWNILTKEVYFSPRWKGILGYNEDELEGVEATWENLLHNDDKEHALKTVKEFLEGKRSVYESEFRMKHKDGRDICILDRGVAVRDENGKIYRMIGTHLDITDWKKSENFLKQINDSISVKTGSSYFSEFTKFCCETLGVKYTLVGHYYKNDDTVQTISFRKESVELPNLKYDLTNTPCVNVLQGTTCIYPRNVQLLFPKDEDLKNLCVEAYLGVPLMDENNVPIGIIVLMDDKPMADTSQKEKLLSFFAARTTNELLRNVTDTKLRASEAFNKGILASLSSHIAVVDNHGTIISVNEAWKNFARQNNEICHESEGEECNYFEICEKAIVNGDVYAEKVFKGLKAVLNKETARFEMEYFYNSPEKRWFILSISGFDGDIHKAVIRRSDITERKKTAEKIKGSEERYRGLFEKMNDGLLFSSPDGIIKMVNPSFCRMVGYTEQELIGKNGYKLLLPEQMRNQIIEKIKERENGNSDQYEIEFITKSGQKIWTQLGASPHYDADGRFAGVMSIISDISERKQHEKELFLSKIKFESVVNNINDALIQDDLSGKIVFYNNRFLEMFGFTEGDLTHLLLEDYNAPEYHEIIRDRHNRRVAGEKVLANYEYEGLRKDGTRIWLEVNVTPITVNGKIAGTQSILRDVTERKKQEKQLRQTVEELNNSYNDLMQFNYIVSHNLRAPIAHILGLSKVFNLPGVSKEEKEKIVGYICHSTSKMDELVKDLSVILAARSTLNSKKEKVFVPLVIKSISDTLEKQIFESGTIIKTEIPDDAKFLFTIKSFMESILYNLVSNAIKYKAPGRVPEVFISLKKTTDNLVIRVTDNGIGIDLNNHGKDIFGLYKRFNLDVEGKGLGLHMTKTQVEALKGKIFVESKIHKGTTFKIVLPVNCIFQSA